MSQKNSSIVIDLNGDNYSGWGFSGTKIIVKEKEEYVRLKVDSNTINAFQKLAQQETTKTYIRNFGLSWVECDKEIEVPLPKTLIRKCRDLKCKEFSFEFMPLEIHAGYQDKIEWTGMLAKGVLPIAESGAVFNHDMSDHFFATASLDPAIAQFWKWRLNILYRLIQNKEVQNDPILEKELHNATRFLSYAFEQATTGISFAMGLIEIDNEKAVKVMNRSYAMFLKDYKTLYSEKRAYSSVSSFTEKVFQILSTSGNKQNFLSLLYSVLDESVRMFPNMSTGHILHGKLPEDLAKEHFNRVVS